MKKRTQSLAEENKQDADTPQMMAADEDDSDEFFDALDEEIDLDENFLDNHFVPETKQSFKRKETLKDIA